MFKTARHLILSWSTVRVIPNYFLSGHFNPLTPNDLQRRRAVSPLKIKIPSKDMREKPTNTPIIIKFINYVW
jgi:hypothetical protein